MAKPQVTVPPTATVTLLGVNVLLDDACTLAERPPPDTGAVIVTAALAVAVTPSRVSDAVIVADPGQS
jgi:hypothetical protein